MSSTASDVAHRLVHSLSPSEKRYFRLYLSKGEGQKAEKYNRLFEMLLKQKEYAADPLMNALKENKARLAVSKNYLYRLILKSMRAYAAEKNLRRQIKGLMSDGIFLYEKTLFTESEKTFQKAWKLAEQCEDHLTLLELVIWERRLLKLTEKGDRKKRMNEAISQKELLFAKLALEFNYQDLADQIYLLGENKGSVQDEQVREFHHHPDLKNPPEGLKAAQYYYRAKIGVTDLLGLEDEAHELGCESLSFWEGRKFLQQDDPVEYQSQFSNLMHLCAGKGKYEDLPALLERLAGLPVSTEREQLFLSQNLLLFELLYALNTGDRMRIAPHSRKHGIWLLKNKEKLHPGRFLVLLVNIAIFEFMSGDFSAALKWVNQLLDAKRLQVRQDLIQMSRLLELVIYYEKEEFELLHHRLRSAEYHFGKSGGSVFTTVCLRYFRELLNASLIEKKTVARKFLDSLRENANSDSHGQALGFEEMTTWLSAQIDNRSMFELIREKYEGQQS